jgi:hypothetical protein
MKNLANLLLISVFAASCINLNGQLNVEQTMSAKTKGGFLNLKKRTVTVAPGSYNADLKINGDKNFVLKLQLSNDSDKEILIPIKSRDSLNLPDNGDVRISGDDISQPFDINGIIKTDTSESSTTTSRESCTYTRREKRLEKVCTTTNPRGSDVSVTRCEEVVRNVEVSVAGTRLVDSHIRYTNRVLTAKFNDINTAAQLATFRASGTTSEKINDFVGICR